MSQEKVEYKQNKKKNRKADLKKQKMQNTIVAVVVAIVVIAVAIWIGFSIYKKVDAIITNTASTATIEHVETDISAISDYVGELSDNE